jgi:cell division protein ZapA (FtsZ GTPase activity inhibitor)
MRSRDRSGPERPSSERIAPPAGRSAGSSSSSMSSASSAVAPSSGRGLARSGERSRSRTPAEAVPPLRRVDVHVMGLPLSVRTDREDAWVQGIAQQVNQRVDELRRTARTASAQQLAVLVALNLAEELQTERQRSATRDRDAEDRLEALASGALARVHAALDALGDEDDEAEEEGSADDDG